MEATTPAIVTEEDNATISNGSQQMATDYVHTEALSPIHHLPDSADNLVQIGFARAEISKPDPANCDIPQGVQPTSLAFKIEKNQELTPVYSQTRSTTDFSKIGYTSICFGDGEEDISTL